MYYICIMYIKYLYWFDYFHFYFYFDFLVGLTFEFYLWTICKLLLIIHNTKKVTTSSNVKYINVKYVRNQIKFSRNTWSICDFHYDKVRNRSTKIFENFLNQREDHSRENRRNLSLIKINCSFNAQLSCFLQTSKILNFQTLSWFSNFLNI